MDFALADKSQNGASYSMAREEDNSTGRSQSWTSSGLNAGEMFLDGSTYEPHTDPRTRGWMQRFLGHYGRDEQLLSPEAAIRRSPLCAPSVSTSTWVAC